MEEMQDIRKLQKSVIEKKRRQAHQLRKAGMTRSEIGEKVGAHRDTVGRWLKLDENKLGIKRGGRKHGEARSLTIEQEISLRHSIIGTIPNDLGVEAGFWSRKTIFELIKNQTCIEMPSRTIGEYLKRWGYSCCKPPNRASEKNLKGARWYNSKYLEIRERAQFLGAGIFWGVMTKIKQIDGCTIVSDCMHDSASDNGYMLSAITNQGKVYFRVYKNEINADVLICFIKDFMDEFGGKIVFIFEQFMIKQDEKISEWLAENSDEIDVFYMPCCMDELSILTNEDDKCYP